MTDEQKTTSPTAKKGSASAVCTITSCLPKPGHTIVLDIEPGAQKDKVKKWLDEIRKTKIGRKVLERIDKSGKLVTIQHNGDADIRKKSGKTTKVYWKDLGKTGKGSKIEFDATIPDCGGSWVYEDTKLKKKIEYTATQNLFHELVHAMYIAEGNSRHDEDKEETMTIAMENKYRKEVGGANAPLRDSLKGQLRYSSPSDKRRFIKEFEKELAKQKIKRSLTFGFQGNEKDAAYALNELYKSYDPATDGDLLEYAIDATDWANEDDRALSIVNALSPKQIAGMPESSKKRLIKELEKLWTGPDEEKAIAKLKKYSRT